MAPGKVLSPRNVVGSRLDQMRFMTVVDTVASRYFITGIGYASRRETVIGSAGSLGDLECYL